MISDPEWVVVSRAAERSFLLSIYIVLNTKNLFAPLAFLSSIPRGLTLTLCGGALFANARGQELINLSNVIKSFAVLSALIKLSTSL